MAGRFAGRTGEHAGGGEARPFSREGASAFYRDPAVRTRILEFLGAHDGLPPTARFVTTHPAALFQPLPAEPPSLMWKALEEEPELARSLWDRDGLIADLDLEHVNFDHPWRTYVDPQRCFALQEPVADALDARLSAARIDALHLLGGRGHHWLWRIDRRSRAFAALAELAPAGESSLFDLAPQAPSGAAVGTSAAAAFRGLGMVLEWLGHEVLRSAGAGSAIPVQLTAVRVGKELGDREAISLDLSAFGDPLSTRSTRVPFSWYLKARRLGAHSGLDLPLLVPVPAPRDWPLAEALELRLPERAAAYAATARVEIPNGSAGTLALIAAYRASKLAAFHRWYYAAEAPPGAGAADPGDRFDLTGLPPCAGRILAEPNDRILHPAELQHLVRVLLAGGWHPRDIAGLVRAKLEEDHGWLAGVHFFDPALRADFYVRLFAGMVLTGADRLVDFNCVSAKEKPICPGSGCRFNLADLRDRLLSEEVRWASGR
jgi:hypothetical protein